MTDEKGKNEGRVSRGAYAPPFSLRLTAEEREKLDAMAGTQTIGDYIRVRLFEEPSPRKHRSRPAQDEKALTTVLEELGRSRLSSNLNQIARATHQGALIVTPETEQALITACTDIAAMRKELLTALGREP